MKIVEKVELKHKDRDAINTRFALPLPVEITVMGGPKVEFFQIVVYKENEEDKPDYYLDAETLDSLRAYYVGEGPSGITPNRGVVSATEDVRDLIEIIVEQVRLSIINQKQESHK